MQKIIVVAALELKLFFLVLILKTKKPDGF